MIDDVFVDMHVYFVRKKELKVAGSFINGHWLCSALRSLISKCPKLLTMVGLKLGK